MTAFRIDTDELFDDLLDDDPVVDVEPVPGPGWTAVGSVTAWTPWTGRAALVDGHQVAVFRLAADADGGARFAAIDNLDPFSEANVLARGIVGDADGVVHVASPIRKQRFDLATGDCLDDVEVAVTRHDVLVADGLVHVRLATAPG